MDKVDLGQFFIIISISHLFFSFRIKKNVEALKMGVLEKNVSVRDRKISVRGENIQM